MAYTLQDYYNTGDNTDNMAYANTWQAQTFTASSAYTVTKVSLRVRRDAATKAYTVSCGLYATTAGKPSGTTLETITIDWQTLPTSAGWVDFVFTGVALTGGVVYAIVLYTNATSSWPVYWRVDSTSPTYADGSFVYSTDAGSTWTINTGNDQMFEVYSVLVVSYEDLAATGGGTSGGSAALLLAEYLALAATGGGTSGGSAVLSATYPAVPPVASATVKRMIVAGNDQIWYESA